MIKSLKIFFVLFIFALLLSFENVSAIKLFGEPTYGFPYDTSQNYSKYGIFYGNSTNEGKYNAFDYHSYYQYYLYDNDGNMNFTYYTAYCVNPGKSSTPNPENGGIFNLTPENILYSPSSMSNKTDSMKAYGMIIANIFNSDVGKSVKYKSGNKVWQENYLIMDLAMKSMLLLFPDYDTNADNIALFPRKMFANEIYKNSEFIEKVNKINSLLASGSKLRIIEKEYDIPRNKSFWFRSDSGSKVDIKVSAKNLILDALDKTYNALSDENNVPDLSWSKGTIDKEDDNSFIVNYTIKIKNFKSESSKVNLDFLCNDCNSNNIKFEIFANDEQLSVSNLKNINLVDYINSESTVNLKIKFSSINKICKKINYNFGFNYYDPNLLPTVYRVRHEDDSAFQEFYVALNENNDSKIESLNMCNLDCNDIKSRCSLGDSSYCDIFNNDFGGKCAECTTTISPITCGNNFDIVEGIEVKNSDSCEVSERPNITECISDYEGKDLAENLYTATKIISDNKYCKVSCKEDFHFDFPGNKEVGAGRYFVLNASIRGTKTCYTNKIDKDTFLEDLNKAADKTIDAYNDLKLAEAAPSVSCTTTHPSCKDEPGKTITRYHCTVKYDGYSKDENKIKSMEDEYWDGSTSSCENGDEPVYESVSTAKNRLDENIKSLNNIIESYNRCSTWDFDYNFNPVINFDYDENYMEKANDKMDSRSSASSIDMKICPYDVDKSYSFCGNTNNENINWQISNSSDVLRMAYCFKYNDNYNCGMNDIKYNNAVRVKKSQTITNNYITPTQFGTVSPTGTIVITNNHNEQNITLLENGLPVAITTSPYIGKYKFIISDLGEYYNDDKIGRIMGDDDSVINKIAQLKENKSNVCINNMNLDALDNDSNYSCEYNVVPDGGACYRDDYNKIYKCKNGDDCEFKDWLKECCPDCPTSIENICVKNIEENRFTGKNGEKLNSLQEWKDACACYKDDKSGLYILDDGTYTQSESLYKNKCDCPECKISITNFAKYRQISLTNFDPNKSYLSSNWRYNEPPKDNKEIKAYVTTNDIIEKGEKIYEEKSDDFVMKFTMDSALINKIKSYNKEHSSSGYLNNTLNCYDYEDYKNIFCYSTFIDDLLYDENTKSKIVVNSKRLIGSNKEETDNLRKNRTFSSGYWTPFINGSEIWEEVTKLGFVLDFSGSSITTGPSWK